MYIHNDNNVVVRILGIRTNSCIIVIFDFSKQCEG